MLRNIRKRLTYANVVATIALFLALSAGAAYAGAFVTSEDIVDGQVKRVDLADSAVGTSNLGGGAVTSAKVRDGSLTGADVDESTLTGVDARRLGGRYPRQITGLSGAVTSAETPLPGCDDPVQYVSDGFTAARRGYVMVLVSVSATHPAGTPVEPFAARIEQIEPGHTVGSFERDAIPAGHGYANVSIAEAFQVFEGRNFFSINVCDGSDDVGPDSGMAVSGHIQFVYSPFYL